MRLLGGRSGPPIKRSKSVGLTYCVPAIHCKLEMVGRGGMTASGLKSLSCERRERLAGAPDVEHGDFGRRGPADDVA